MKMISSSAIYAVAAIASIAAANKLKGKLVGRLKNSEIEFYEETLGNIRAITESVRRLIYEAGENPVLLADLARIAEHAAAIKERTIADRRRRESELNTK
jgi:hypothetical protein